MDVHALASRFAALCAEGKLDEAQQFWSDDVVSIEGFPGPHQICRGRDAVLEKQRMWNAGTTMHSVACEGPYVNGEQFAVRFSLDCTDREGHRSTMHETALYTVSDGKIVEERFFPMVG